MYTYSSSNLKEAHLEKYFTYTYGYTTRAMNTYGGGSVYESSTLTTRTVCMSNCTYGEDTLRLNDIQHAKFSLH